MANKIRVLTSIDDVKPEAYEGEVTREMSITWLIDDLTELLDEYPELCWSDIVFEGDTSFKSNELIFGNEQPEKLLKEVKAWNVRIRGRVINIIKGIESNMAMYPHYHVGMNISEWMEGLSVPEIRAGIPYDMSSGQAIPLNAAIGELYGYPTWYSDHLVFRAENERCTRQDGTLITEDTMDSVLKHPENYAIIELANDL